MNDWQLWKLKQMEKRVIPTDPTDKYEPEWTEKTVGDYRLQLDALKECTFRPGSYEKRFVRDVSSMSDGQILSTKMIELIENLYHRYRRQIPNHKRLCVICGRPKNG